MNIRKLFFAMADTNHSRPRRMRSALCSIFAVLLLVGTNGALAEAPDPHVDMMTAVQALRNNDLAKIFNEVMPADKREEALAEWEAMKSQPITDEDRQQFNAAVGMLLAPNAVDILMSFVTPQLNELRGNWETQVAGMEGLVMFFIESAQDMSPGDKEQATRGVQAIANWARQNDLTDEALAREAVTVAVNTAQELEILTIDDIHGLSIDEALVRGGKIIGGVKGVLNVYGISLDNILDSFNAETVWREGNKAKVKIGATLLEEPFETEVDLEYVDGIWIDPTVGESLAALDPGTGDTGSPYTLQEMPEVTAVPDTLGADALEAGLSAAQVYLSYRDTLNEATEFQEITGFWMSWLEQSAADQDQSTLAAKLDALKQAASNVQIVGEHYGDQQVLLDVIGQGPASEPLDGKITLAVEGPHWKIQEIAWAQRVAGMDLPEQETPVFTQIPTDLAPTETTTGVVDTNVALNTVETEQQPVDKTMDVIKVTPEVTTTEVSGSVETDSDQTADTTQIADTTTVESTTDETVQESPTEDTTEVVETESGTQNSTSVADQTSQAPIPPVASKEALQQDFDRNPFLRRYGVNILVQSVDDGFLSADISGGSDSLIKSVQSGYDLVEGDVDTLASNQDKQIAQAVRKTINAVQKKYDLVAVLIVAPVPEGEVAETEPVVEVSVVEEPPEDTATANVEQEQEGDPEAPTKSEAEKQAEVAAAQRQEERRERVRQIQTLLNKYGFNAGVADGLAGKGTRGAIRAYQRAAGLLEDGEPTEELLAHLNSDRAVTNPELSAPAADVAEGEPEEEAPKKEGKVKSLIKSIFSGEGKAGEQNVGGKNN